MSRSRNARAFGSAYLVVATLAALAAFGTRAAAPSGPGTGATCSRSWASTFLIIESLTEVARG